MYCVLILAVQVSINRPVAELTEKLCDLLGVGESHIDEQRSCQCVIYIVYVYTCRECGPLYTVCGGRVSHLSEGGGAGGGGVIPERGGPLQLPHSHHGSPVAPRPGLRAHLIEIFSVTSHAGHHDFTSTGTCVSGYE